MMIDSDALYYRYVGKDGVPVPTHYYIIIISCKHGDILNCITTDLELLSFILPHLPAVPNCMVSF